MLKRASQHKLQECCHVVDRLRSRTQLCTQVAAGPARRVDQYCRREWKHSANTKALVEQVIEDMATFWGRGERVDSTKGCFSLCPRQSWKFADCRMGDLARTGQTTTALTAVTVNFLATKPQWFLGLWEWLATLVFVENSSSSGRRGLAAS